MKPGDTFILLGEDIHLWIVVSDPQLNAEKVVLLSFTSWQHIHDQTCIVHPGEHPWIIRRSIVYYPAPRLLSLAQLQTRQTQGLLIARDPLSEVLLKKVRMGAFKSLFIPLEAQDILCDQFPDLADEANT